MALHAKMRAEGTDPVQDVMPGVIRHRQQVKESRLRHIDKRKAYDKRHREEHREERCAYAKSYREQHQEEIARRTKQYRQEHAEQLKARAAKMRAEQREYLAAKQRVYMAKKKGLPPEVLAQRIAEMNLEKQKLEQKQKEGMSGN